MYADLSRPPLRASAVTRGVVHEGSPWREIRILPTATSTNALVARAARDGDAEGLVVVAEHQLAGRGRLDRAWVTPARAALTFSVLLRPGADVPAARWALLPLLAGVSVLRAVRRLGAIPVALKWPNDLLHDGQKLAGLLAEVVGAGPDGAVVLGIGLNVSSQPDELPPGATSLALAGAACTDRDPLLRAMLRELGNDYVRWRSCAGDPGASGLLVEYAAGCDTLGRRVTVSLPAGGPLVGVAERVDSDGRLVVSTPRGLQAVAAGDVTHVR